MPKLANAGHHHSTSRFSSPSTRPLPSTLAAPSLREEAVPELSNARHHHKVVVDAAVNLRGDQLHLGVLAAHLGVKVWGQVGAGSAE